MNRARTAASSGHAAAASTSARGRHETRSGPCETRRSSSRYVRDIRTQPTVRVVRWGGTRTCTGGVMRQPGRACNAAAVGPASQESGPASSKAAIRRCCADGSPASSSRTLGRTTRHPRPTDQRICASVTPPSRSWRRVARPSWRSTSSAVCGGSMGPASRTPFPAGDATLQLCMTRRFGHTMWTMRRSSTAHPPRSCRRRREWRGWREVTAVVVAAPLSWERHESRYDGRYHRRFKRCRWRGLGATLISSRGEKG
jgi:hypothetical protein